MPSLFCSEDALELSIMPKDEDILQLVSYLPGPGDILPTVDWKASWA